MDKRRYIAIVVIYNGYRKDTITFTYTGSSSADWSDGCLNTPL